MDYDGQGERCPNPMRQSLNPAMLRGQDHSNAALSGIRVLELPTQLTAYAGKLLADLGAEVLLVEPPAGSAERQRGPVWEQGGRLASVSFLHFHANKRGLTLDPHPTSGGRLLMRLAANADVLLTGRAPELVPALRKTNERLIITVVTPFGLESAGRTDATDLELVARGGLAHLTGEPAGPPTRPGGDQAFLNAGLQAATATLLALAARARTGRGQVVDVAALRALPVTNHTAMVDFDLAGTVLTRLGARHPSAADGLYPCRDGWVVLSGGSWDALAAWVEAEGAGGGLRLTDRRWRDARERVDRAAEVDAVLEPWLRRRGREELHAEALRRGVMLAPVRDPEELLADPQLRARGFFQRLPGIPAEFPGAPYRLSATPRRLRAPAPALGEANDAIYAGTLGLSRAERAALKAAGAI